VVSYLAMSIALRIARGAIARIPSAHAGRFVGDLGEILRGTSRRLMLLTALLIGIGTLHLPEPWNARLSHLWFLTLMLQLALWANRAITLGLARHFDRHAGTGAQAGASSTLLSWALRVLLWTVALLAVLSNIGVNITAFIASLGIGGVAVALAVQNILGDLFASLSIAVDKPFEVGDAIGVGGVSGSVEYVGLRSTRIRAIGGEQIIMSNTDLLKQTINNYKRMATRRVVFTFGVTYDTSPEDAEAIPGLVKAIIESSDKLRFGRAHFKAFGDSALTYEVVYTVLIADYDLFMDLQQMINLRLMRELNTLGVGFAFPTRTVHIAGAAPRGDPGRQEGDGPPAGTIPG
jgi:small-conductance mechanosensitive channel